MAVRNIDRGFYKLPDFTETIQLQVGGAFTTTINALIYKIGQIRGIEIPSFNGTSTINTYISLKLPTEYVEDSSSTTIISYNFWFKNGSSYSLGFIYYDVGQGQINIYSGGNFNGFNVGNNCGLPNPIYLNIAA